jgi:hypothetical protein
MAQRFVFALLLASCALLTTPKAAHAQYKNKAFGLDVSYQLISQPPITDGANDVVPISSRGNRLHDGIRVGGEGSFKMHHDHWWFNTRLDLSFLGYGRPKGDSPEAEADRLAGENLGTNLGVDGQIGVRYYLLTDHFRPYLQASLSYMHIFSFGGGASATCLNPLLCDSSQATYGANFLPHNNIIAVHVAPSFEYIVRRDLGLHIILDYQRWLVFSGKGNNVFTMGAGLTFYG